MYTDTVFHEIFAQCHVIILSLQFIIQFHHFISIVYLKMYNTHTAFEVPA